MPSILIVKKEEVSEVKAIYADRIDIDIKDMNIVYRVKGKYLYNYDIKIEEGDTIYIDGVQVYPITKNEPFIPPSVVESFIASYGINSPNKEK